MTNPLKRHELIINNPKLMKFQRRIFEFLLTFAGWYIWFILLIRPCIRFMEHYKHHPLKHFFSIQFIGETFYLYELFFAVILVIFLILFWNRFNLRRFRGKDTRKSRGNATSDLLGKYYGIPEKDIVDIQNKKRISIDFLDNQGIVINDKIKGTYAPNDISLHLKNIKEA